MSSIEKHNQGLDKLIKLEERKILQAKNKITKIRVGFEGGFYGLDEAKLEIKRIRSLVGKQ